MNIYSALNLIKIKYLKFIKKNKDMSTTKDLTIDEVTQM